MVGRKPIHKVRLRLVAVPPMKGELPHFDRMIESGLSERQCVLALLRDSSDVLRAFSKMAPSDFRALTYERDGTPIETNQMIGKRLFRSIKSQIDPFDAFTDRALGQKLGEALVCMRAKESDKERRNQKDV